MDGRIFELTQKLEEKLSEMWTAKEMARGLDLSVSHFQKLFREEVGMSPITYVRELRFEKARELLETTFIQITQIGVRTGLTNDSHFTRDFKRKFGMTPTEYRRAHRERIQAEVRPNGQIIESAKEKDSSPRENY